MLRFFGLFFLIGLSLIGSAQLGNIRFDKHTTVNGLSDNNTNAIFQDNHGFLWIGSNHGVNRYDGRVFRKYTTLGDHGLSDLSIVCMTETPDGNIWIGTQNGLNRLNPFTDSITSYFEGNGPGTIPYKWCNYLYVDKQKNLWLSTEKGLALYNKKTDSFQNYPISVSGSDGRINKFISKILEDSKGRLWLSTSYGVKLFNRKTKTYKSYFYAQTSRESSAYPVISIYESTDGRLWAGTWYSGLLLYNEKLDVFESQLLPTIDFKKLVISDVDQCTFQNQNYLILSTSSGLIMKSLNSDTSQLLSLSENVSQIYKDKLDNLWFTSVGGLYKLNNNFLAFDWLQLPAKTPENNLIYHIIPDLQKPGSNFFLSTLNGWWRYDNETHKIKRLNTPHDPKNLLGGINNWVIDNQAYWFTSIHGFGAYNPVKNKLIDLSTLILENSGQVSTGKIVMDKYHKLWITLHRSGILVYDTENKSVETLLNQKHLAKNTLGQDINDLKAATDGNIYLTSGNALYKIKSDSKKITTFSPEINDKRIDVFKIAPDQILFAPEGRIFVSSQLVIYEFIKNKLIQVYPEKGYSEFSFEKLFCENDGTIWAVTSRGIFKTDTTFRHWININSRLGWNDDEIFTDLFVINPGEVIISGKNKIGLLNDSLLLKSSQPSAILISRIRYGDTEKFMLASDVAEIRCGYNESIEIELACFDFNFVKENKILYTLDGWDNKWKEMTATQSIRFEQLPPGLYIFKAKQINAEGEESPVTSICVRIPQPFYKSWWFIVILVAAGFGIHFSVNRYRKMKALELEQLRMRIASDLHDDIGATLSSISIYSDALKSQLQHENPNITYVLEKMGENSREMVTSMSDIVWAINPGNDVGEKLINRMHNYAADICAMKNIQLHFSAEKKLKSLILPLEHRKNIYLIFKESIHNSIKYADASNIWVSIQRKEKLLYLEIKDDGKGFDEKTVLKGNGLKNIRKRALELGAEINLTSNENSGTSIVIQWKSE